MSQSPMVIDNESGALYRADANAAHLALLTHHKDSGPPDYAEAGTIWLDDGATPWTLKIYDGTDWISLGEVNGTRDTFVPVRTNMIGKKVITHHGGPGDTSSTITAIGGAALTTTGTVAGVTPSGASKLGTFYRTSFTTAASTASDAGAVSPARVYRGSASGGGGFKFRWRGAIDTVASGNAVLIGLTSSASDIGNVDPSLLTNVVGFGADAADSNLQWVVNDASGSATKTDLGANFPAKTNGAIYDVEIYCAPNDTVVTYKIERIDSAQFSSGSSNSNLPVNTTALYAQFHIGTRADSAAAAISLQAQGIEIYQ